MIATTYSLALLALQAAEHEGGLSPYIPKTFNLLVFLGIMFFLLRKPMGAFFEARSRAIKDDLERAKRDKEAAEAKLAEVEARLARLGEEQERIRAEAEAEAQAEHERTRARAEEDARKIAETAEREIGGALKSARAELQRFVAEQSVALAESTIKSEIGDADNHRMVDQYADQLQGVRK